MENLENKEVSLTKDGQLNLKEPSHYQYHYNLKYGIFFPITFLRRVAFGKDELGRRFFFDKWGFLPKELVQIAAKRKTIWIIANSGGELRQCISLFKKLKKILPEYNLLVSTESYDTFKYGQTLEGVDFVFFPPWDISLVCKLVLKRLKPRAVIFIEHCYFPVLSRMAKELKIKTLMCSGLIDYQILKGHVLMQRSFALEFYKFIDQFALKGKEDFDNLVNLGMDPKKISVLGDLKFELEQLLLSEEERKKLKKDLGFSEDDLIFVVGSLHKQEVELVLSSFHNVSKEFPKLKLILAPRWKVDCQFIKDKIKEYGYVFNFRSQLNSSQSRAYDILIIDTFGELARIYGIASAVFIASSIVPINIRCLGHNIFEPLAHGVPVIFGPNMGLWRKFTDSLKEVWPECEVKDADTLASSLSKILNNENLKGELKDCSLRLTGSHRGIAQRYVELIQDSVSSTERPI
jgi:3-deoxy-D-manno-octulosonic-acid transferase